MKTKVQLAEELRDAAVERMHAAADAADADGATEDAHQAFRDAKAEVEKRNADLDRAEETEKARASHPKPAPLDDDKKRAAGAAAGQIKVGREPLLYERHNMRDSYLLDLARANIQGDSASKAKLARHAQEMQVELDARERMRDAGFNTEMNSLLGEIERTNPGLARALEAQMVVKRDITRVDGVGGEFVPPLWALDLYAEAPRNQRPFADAVRHIPLPGGTDSINIPRITTGTLTGVQTADNAAVTEQDIATATVTAPVRTIAGQQDIALQLLEQSPIAFDQIVFADLFTDYDQQVDAQCVNGSGASGQVLGILNTASINAITYTDATPTVPELYPKLADALNQASNNRKIVPSHFWWHGRRWFWAAKEVDSTTRPFFIAASAGPNNAYGSYDQAMNQGGPVTNVLGVPVMLDLNIPTNLGGGTNEDRIIATRMFDHILFEGGLRSRVLPEVLSGNLTVRLQVYAYCAFTAGRFPTATSVISGTGLLTPTF